jgi:hypothetical protein
MTLKRVPSLAQKDLLDIQQLLKQAHARANEIEAEGQSVRPALDALEGQVTAAAAQLAAASAAAALELRLAQDAALQAQRRTDELEAVTRVEGERDLAHIQKLTDALAAAEAARGAAEEAAAAQKRRAHEDEKRHGTKTASIRLKADKEVKRAQDEAASALARATTAEAVAAGFTAREDSLQKALAAAQAARKDEAERAAAVLKAAQKREKKLQEQLVAAKKGTAAEAASGRAVKATLARAVREAEAEAATAAVKATEVGSPQWQRRWKGYAAARDGSGTPAPSPLRPAPTPTAAAAAAVAHPLVDPAAPAAADEALVAAAPAAEVEDPRVAALEQQLAECQRALLEGRQLRLSERARARDAAEREHAGEVEAASASAALAAHELAAAAHAECESLRAALRDAEATIAVQRGVLSEVVARERVVVSTLGADVRSLERRLASARAHAIRGATLLQQRVDKSEREAAHAVKVAQRAAKHAAKSGGESKAAARAELIETREALAAMREALAECEREREAAEATASAATARLERYRAAQLSGGRDDAERRRDAAVRSRDEQIAAMTRLGLINQVAAQI